MLGLLLFGEKYWFKKKGMYCAIGLTSEIWKIYLISMHYEQEMKVTDNYLPMG